jgi:DNA-binding CsgD family transcriptional regulator
MTDEPSEIQSALRLVNETTLHLRDLIVRELAAAGLPSKVIAQRIGLTRQRVEQIVKGGAS